MKIKDYAKQWTDLHGSYKQSWETVENWLIRLDDFIIRATHANPYKVTRESQLIMGGNFVKAYDWWLMSKVDYFSENIDGYNYYVGLFRTAFEDFQREQKRFRDAAKKLIGLIPTTEPGQFYSCELIESVTGKRPCKVGTLATGIGHVELTMEQYREELKREPVMTPKKFRRFSFCPDCGREIDWRENDETD